VEPQNTENDGVRAEVGQGLNAIAEDAGERRDLLGYWQIGIDAHLQVERPAGCIHRLARGGAKLRIERVPRSIITRWCTTIHISKRAGLVTGKNIGSGQSRWVPKDVQTINQPSATGDQG